MSLPLYKGRYLICVYSKYEILLDVFENAKEVQEFLNSRGAHYSLNGVYSKLNHILKGKCNSSLIKFVDVFETHDDVFKEEDELFLKYLNQRETKTLTQKIMEEYNCSLRTAQRKKKFLLER